MSSKTETVYKKISQNVNLFIDTCISILKIIGASRFHFKKLPVKTNERCIILGNGPSLKESLTDHLEFIKTLDMVCVNTFAYSEYFEVLKPQNYVLLDPYYYKYTDKTIESRESVKPTFEKFKTIDWPINFMLPAKAKNSYLVKSVLSTNKNISIYYFNYIVTEGFTFFRHFVYRKGMGMPQCQNVLGATVFLSINRNYKEIYVVGADHSWHENFSIQQDNEMLVKDSHFFDKKPANTIVLSDLIKYRLSVSNFFLSLHKSFKTYDILKLYADSRKVKIINASAKSYIDSFERKKLG